jgi:hypothetical protein
VSQDFRKRPDRQCRWCSGTGFTYYVNDLAAFDAPCPCTDVFPRDTWASQLRRWWATFRYHLKVVSQGDDEYPF